MSGKFKDSIKLDIVKQLKLSSLSFVIIENDSQIEEFETVYYTGQAFVGRYFGDFGLDWIVWNYYEISSYILKYHCRDSLIHNQSVKNALKEYVPFERSQSKLSPT